MLGRVISCSGDVLGALRKHPGGCEKFGTTATWNDWCRTMKIAKQGIVSRMCGR